MNTLAVIVNYKAALLTLAAVRSVFDSPCRGSLRVVVVDNSEDQHEAAVLGDRLPPETELIVNGHNAGFGQACNQAYGRSSEDYVLLLNPDTRLLPGALRRLQALCCREGIGAVGPQIYWDADLQFLLPPSYPGALSCLAPALARQGRAGCIYRFLAALWRSYQLRVWLARRPARVFNLSGGHVLLKREAVERAGGLFDPRFFLYFEDTDLFLRLRKAGYRLYVEPAARVVHFYDQCGRGEWQAKRKHMEVSREVFGKKHWHGWPARLNRLLGILPEGRRRRKPGNHSGRHSQPFTLDVPAELQGAWLFEWSPSPDFMPSVGRLGKGPSMVFPPECWSLLAPGEYYGRLGSPCHFSRFRQHVSWVVETVTP